MIYCIRSSLRISVFNSCVPTMLQSNKRREEATVTHGARQCNGTERESEQLLSLEILQDLPHKRRALAVWAAATIAYDSL